MSRIVNKLLSTTGGGVETDPNFANVSLLLHGDGTNGAQNNTFLDSSTNNFTITRSGNTTQGSYSPYGDRWSNYFDGTGDYLSVAASSSVNIGADQFNIECWVYLISTDRYSGFYHGEVTGSLFFGLFESTTRLILSKQGSNLVIAPDALPLNEWVHVAASRDGSNVIRLFVNGSLVASGTHSDTFASSVMDIPRRNKANNFYISDMRLIKGTALYTSNFTPPTGPLTAVSGTSLLTCQSNRFKDNSSNDFAITVNGGPKVTPFSPYAPSAAYNPATGGGSGYFDGAGDYLSVAADTALTLGSSDFTIEFWLYFNTLSNNDTTISQGTSAQADNWQLAYYGGVLQLYYSNASNVFGSTVFSTGQWYHIAIVGEGSTVKVYVDGVLDINQSYSYNYGSYVTRIGINRGGTVYLDGYISDVRIVKGTALYTANFTPPTAPLTAVTNTSLLCSFTNAGIFDSTAKNVLETVGNAQIDTAVTKFGTGSMEFDGTGDYLSMPQSTQTQFGAGDFTMEGWFYRNNTNDGVIYGDRGAVAVYGGLLIGFRNNYVFIAISVNGSSWAINTYASTAGSTVSAATWTHIAIVRSGSTCSVYINGIESYNQTLSGAIVQTEPKVLIGADPAASPVPNFNGYIDDFRITKGVARYTAAFTPPTKAFPDQ